MLPKLEPSLTTSRLRHLATKHPAAGSGPGLAQIAEYLTGVGPNFQLIGCCRNMTTVIDYLVQRCQKRGRALSLVLPPDWQAQGIYCLGDVLKGSCVEITQRWTGHSISVDVSSLPAFVSLTELSIGKNWSEADAEVVSRSSPSKKSFRFGFLFPAESHEPVIEDGPATPPFKKATKAVRRVAVQKIGLQSSTEQGSAIDSEA